LIYANPLVAIALSFTFLGVLLYKRVNLGITLNATAIILGLLAISWQDIPDIIFTTSTSLLTLSVVLATFGIMWLSQLYRDTGLIKRLSESLGRLLKSPRIVLSILPAIIGFLPVAGGALMSAPLVETEGDKIGLTPEKKAYVNLWFRHTIFPVYPISQVLILTALLAGTTVSALILRQIPVVIAMIVTGYVIGFWKTRNPRTNAATTQPSTFNADVRAFFTVFSPVLVTIAVAVGLEVVAPDLAKLGVDVLAATFVGVAVLALIAKPRLRDLANPLRRRGIYGITFAAYGAFLLGNMVKATNISGLFEDLALSGSVDQTLLLAITPAVLGAATASALGGVSISVPLLAGIFTLSPETASLIYMSAYLGYVISPTHLCLAFTMDYFKCPLSKAYKYVIPSFLITYGTAVLVYFFL
jgi:integral membrane protein (TIGR00529 family)